MPAKGELGGQCATRGCDQRARFISEHEERVSPDPRYRCTDCVSEIDARIERAAARELADMLSAGEREHPLALVLTFVALVLAIVVVVALI